MLAHTFFAFNSYWQRTKASGATCDFGGTAMLITNDPSKRHLISISAVPETKNAQMFQKIRGIRGYDALSFSGYDGCRYILM
jgi:hypothetical protein